MAPVRPMPAAGTLSWPPLPAGRTTRPLKAPGYLTNRKSHAHDPRRPAYGRGLGGADLDATAVWTVGAGERGGDHSSTLQRRGQYSRQMPTRRRCAASGGRDRLRHGYADDHGPVNPATPTIRRGRRLRHTYGTALGGADLERHSSWTVGGTLGSVKTYTRRTPEVLAAGNHTLSVTFTPTDTTDYTAHRSR